MRRLFRLQLCITSAVLDAKNVIVREMSCQISSLKTWSYPVTHEPVRIYFYRDAIKLLFVILSKISQPQQGELLQLYSGVLACLLASLERDLRFVH